jgi:hypothetical protein
MDEEFGTTVLATYAELCIDWRREVTSFRSNGTEINSKLLSLEGVIRAFDLDVPGLVESVPQVTVAHITVQEDAAELQEGKEEIPQPRPAARTLVDA